MARKEDITIVQERETPMRDVSTDEVLTMVLGTDEDDIEIGRMGGFNMDPSEFDALPAFEWDIDPPTAAEDGLFTGSNPTAPATTPGTSTVMGDDDEIVDEDMPAPFTSPKAEVFPTYKRALKHFRDAETPTRVVRIDTDATYNDFVGERAIKELARRLTELRSFVEAHVRDMSAHNSWSPPEAPMSDWSEVIGAAEAVNSLRAASTAGEAVDAMPEIPLDLPDYAQGKVKCWRDGDDVVVSLRFCAADGTPRIASMAARPRVDAEDIVGWAARAGAHPVAVLGIACDLAASACGKRLVRDAAGAALQAQRRLDIVGMTDDDAPEPVLLTNGGDEDTAPLAALMFVQQLADAGDDQACREMGLIRAAAQTPHGRQVAAPILEESTKRLAEGRRRKRDESEDSIVGGIWR